LKVSPTAKVPTLEVGPEKTVLVESAITTKLVGELYPKSGLISEDPIVNAQSELWADRYLNAFNGPVFSKALQSEEWSEKEGEKAFFEALDSVLPYLGDAGPFAAGQIQPKVGDLLVAPFLGRLHLFIEKGILPSTINEKYKSNPKYSNYTKYVEALYALPAFKKVYDAEGRFKSFAGQVGQRKPLL